MSPETSCARNVLAAASGLSRDRANWLAENMTTAEVETLATSSPTPSADTAKTIAADVLTRLSASIRPPQ